MGDESGVGIVTRVRRGWNAAVVNKGMVASRYLRRTGSGLWRALRMVVPCVARVRGGRA